MGILPRVLGRILPLAAGLLFAEDRFRALQALPLDDSALEGHALALLREMPDNRNVLRLWQQGAAARGDVRFAECVGRFLEEVMMGERLPAPPPEEGVETAEFLMIRERLEACADAPCRAAWLPDMRRLLENPPHAAGEALELAALYRAQGDVLPAAILGHHALRAGQPGERVREQYFSDLQTLGLRAVELREWERWTDPEKATSAQLQALVRRLLELGAAPPAQTWSHRWVRRYPDNGEAWLWSGRTALANQDLDGAERDFAQALRHLADPLPAWRELAKLSAEKRDVEQTKVWLKKVQPRLGEEAWVTFLMEPAFGKVPEVMLGW